MDKSLRKELDQISAQIHALKDKLPATQDPVELKRLQKQIKQLQWQALFYLEKIENLRRISRKNKERLI